MRYKFLALTLTVLAVVLSTAMADTTFSPNGINSGQGVAITSGDFNRDGWPDLAILQRNNELAIFFGTSSGNFTLGPSFNIAEPQCDRCRSLVTADFNHDGILDIAIGHGGPEAFFQVYRGMGDGTFIPGPSYVTPGPVMNIAAGDFNGDKVPDVVITTFKAYNQPSAVQIWTSNGDMSFRASQTLTTPATTAYPAIFGHSLVVADMNRDGKNDIVVGADGKILIYAGSGTGTVHLLSKITPPANTVVAFTSVRVAALRSGTAQDLVVQGDNGGAPDCCLNVYTFVYLNNGSATSFTRKQTFAWYGVVNGGEVAIGDLNGDRKMDLLFVNESPSNDNIGYAYGNGDGTFQAINNFTSTEDPTGVVVRDFNLDSRHDFAVSDAIDGLVWFTNTNATTNCPTPSSASQNVHICMAFWNKDHMSVQAAGNAPAGVKRLEVWVDGVKKYQVYNDQLRAGITGLSSGLHKVIFQVVDAYDKIGKQTVSVAVP